MESKIFKGIMTHIGDMPIELITKLQKIIEKHNEVNRNFGGKDDTCLCVWGTFEKAIGMYIGGKSIIAYVLDDDGYRCNAYVEFLPDWLDISKYLIPIIQ